MLSSKFLFICLLLLRWFCRAHEYLNQADKQTFGIGSQNVTSQVPIDLSHFRSSLTSSTHRGRRSTNALAMPEGYELFATVGGENCAKNLFYGPQTISTAGSADNHKYYLATNTAGKNKLHNRWLQIVVNGDDQEIFRITWVFQTYKTLANHIINAVSNGEIVTYTVFYNNKTTVYNDAMWRFSSSAAVTNSRFTATSSQCCFSANGGAWGAGSPIVDGSVTDYGSQQFCGTGNFGNYDENQCDWVFAQGGIITNLNPKSYLFYSQDGPPTAAPTAAPSTAKPSTARPSATPTSAKPSIQPTLRPTAVPTSAAPTYTVTAVPTAVPTLAPSVAPTTTKAPTAAPTTVQPSITPSYVPSAEPTSSAPTLVPSATPSYIPSLAPSVIPSAAPSAQPSIVPSTTPTVLPTFTPAPSAQPSTAVPSVIPSTLPTPAPSRAPTPTPRPSYTPATELFAVVGSQSCAENLYFGPQAITTEGSADGVYRLFVSTATASRNIAHNTWMQVVTSDGVNEVFRIFWTFATMKTLANRFIDAVQVGESVSYRVVESNGREYSFSGTWRFASNSGINAATFATTETKCCFSQDDAAWGGGQGVIDGANAQTVYNANFWGMGNFDGDDSGCRAFYRNGRITTSPGVRSFMYYSASGSDADRFNLKFQIDMNLLRINAANYVAKKETYENVLSKTVAAALLGVSSFDVSDFTVTDTTSSGRLAVVPFTTSDGIDTVPTTSVVKAVTTYLRGGRQSAPTRRLQINTNSALVTCIVTLESSVYTYFQMTQQFESSISDGTFNSWMTNYANYLQIYELNSTTIQSATYTDMSEKESADGKQRRFFTTTNIVGVVVAAIAGLCIVVYACAWFFVGGSFRELKLCGMFRQNSRVFVTPPPEHDVSSVHSFESEADPSPIYPATATLQPLADGDAALVNTLISPVVGVMAPDESDVDDAIAPEDYHHRYRTNNTNNTRTSDPRGASEVAWSQTNGNRGHIHNNGSTQLPHQQYPAEMHPMDVIVPRAVVARHARNAPIVRAQIVHSDVPEAETASVNYGQYGRNVAVAEAFVPNP